ncbi:MAG TPA: nitroreductase family protein [Streptosporangiaceae bacterium]
MSRPFDTRVTDHLLSTTRAVRKRLDLDRPVEREVLMECLRLAIQAPTGSNSQGWHWVIVTDAAKRAGLADLYRAGGEAYFSAMGRNTQTASGQQARVLDSARHLLEVIDHVPVLVVPCIEGRITDVRQAAGFFGSIHPAIWSFQLALRSRGLGSAWTTFHLAHERQAAELLGIPYDDVTQAALLPVAYTVGTDFRPAKRRPAEEITHWNSWT